MEILLIIVAAIIVVLSTVLSYYTSVNSGASIFEKWIEKKEKKENK